MRLTILSVYSLLTLFSPALAQESVPQMGPPAPITARDAERSAMLSDILAAAGQGNADAQYEAGVRYANGEGVAVDYNEAAEWFAKAARAGNLAARQQLVFLAQLGLTPVSLANLPPLPSTAPGGGTTAGTTAAGAAAPADGAFHVQVASVSNEADGAREWRRLQRLHPEVLGSLAVSVVGFEAANGDRLFRVEGGPLDESAARDACTKLRAAGAGCRIVRPN
jgi:TPR repeat protein